ncbi:hypothetical protein CRG98_046161 [Punica granatum]|uniref:Uncharacterized protein n=1 Tax=Punica granatum TaxID=22663 RepID=A0A2I0HP20_PUNGR|nr:hypothetical protein CRG98_046161 [Punica granatum]
MENTIAHNLRADFKRDKEVMFDPRRVKRHSATISQRWPIIPSLRRRGEQCWKSDNVAGELGTRSGLDRLDWMDWLREGHSARADGSGYFFGLARELGAFQKLLDIAAGDSWASWA